MKNNHPHTKNRTYKQLLIEGRTVQVASVDYTGKVERNNQPERRPTWTVWYFPVSYVVPINDLLKKNRVECTESCSLPAKPP